MTGQDSKVQGANKCIRVLICHLMPGSPTLAWVGGDSHCGIGLYIAQNHPLSAPHMSCTELHWESHYELA